MFPFKTYTPSNWYWIVADNTTQVWSSAKAAYVPVTDATYTQWLALGYFPTRIINEAELQEVLAKAYPQGWPQSQQQLAQTMLQNGMTITSTSGNFTATFAVTQDSQGNAIPTLVTSEILSLQLSNNTQFADGQATVNWPDMSGVLHVMNPTQFQAFSRAMASFVATCRNVINGVAGAVLPPTTPITIP